VVDIPRNCLRGVLALRCESATEARGERFMNRDRVSAVALMLPEKRR
jgi:hypothetical protein